MSGLSAPKRPHVAASSDRSRPACAASQCLALTLQVIPVRESIDLERKRSHEPASPTARSWGQWAETGGPGLGSISRRAHRRLYDHAPHSTRLAKELRPCGVQAHHVPWPLAHRLLESLRCVQTACAGAALLATEMGHDQQRCSLCSRSFARQDLRYTPVSEHDVFGLAGMWRHAEDTCQTPPSVAAADAADPARPRNSPVHCRWAAACATSTATTSAASVGRC